LIKAIPAINGPTAPGLERHLDFFATLSAGNRIKLSAWGLPLGGASLAEYERAYQQTKGKGVMPASALSGTSSTVPLRQSEAENKRANNDINSRGRV